MADSYHVFTAEICNYERSGEANPGPGPRVQCLFPVALKIMTVPRTRRQLRPCATAPFGDGPKAEGRTRGRGGRSHGAARLVHNSRPSPRKCWSRSRDVGGCDAPRSTPMGGGWVGWVAASLQPCALHPQPGSGLGSRPQGHQLHRRDGRDRQQAYGRDLGCRRSRPLSACRGSKGSEPVSPA